MTETPNGSKGNLLIVSYHYPPIFSAGVFRIAAFAGRLQRKGWRTRVLTVKSSPYEATDASSLELLSPPVEVVRARALDPPWAGTSAPPLSAGPANPVRWAARKTRAFLRVVHNKFFSFPDKMVSWGIPMTLRAWRILRGDRYVVLSSSPPHSSQFALSLVRRFVDFKWVADFRDPWTTPSRRPRGALEMKIERRMEAAVLKSCDRVFANTAGNKRGLLETFDFLDDDKVQVVTNGFDESLMDGGANAAAATERVSVDSDMLYMGEVYPGMLDLLLDSLDVLVRKGSPYVPRILLYGLIEDEDLETIQRRGYGDFIRFEGTLPYLASFAAMKRARSLLLLLKHGANFETCVPSKMYSYLFAGPPVIAIAPEGDATAMVETTGVGVAITSSDPEQVAARIEEAVAQLRGEGLPTKRRQSEIERYTIDALAERVDRILSDEVSAW
jgi:hypothetical protein